ncbi:hypothetical protein EU245_08060 [Lentibacillus lipolyticus]|nr:hypothetical protein EU245_08060 [Lentibacillus lipolyticus]
MIAALLDDGFELPGTCFIRAVGNPDVKLVFRLQNVILTVYKWTYPIPGFILVIIAVAIGMLGTMVWLFADMTTALPIFTNVITILILSPKFFALLKDFKARHFGKGC